MCGGVRCMAVPVACIRSVGESAAGAGHGVGLCDRGVGYWSGARCYNVAVCSDTLGTGRLHRLQPSVVVRTHREER